MTGRRLLGLAIAVLLVWAGLRWWHARGGPVVASAASRPHDVPAFAGATVPVAPSLKAASVAWSAHVASTAGAESGCTVEAPTEEDLRLKGDDPADEVDAAAGPVPPRHSPAYVAARRRILDKLSDSPDPYVRAVAVWLQDTSIANAASQRRLALAGMARTTSDPRVYALAFRACRPSNDRDGCQALSVQRWVALDPGNAAPWLFALDDAVSAGDVSGQEAALFHLAGSNRVDDRFDTPIGPIIDAAGLGGAEPAAANGLAVEAIGLSAAQIGYEFTLTKLCRASAPADANRMQLCLASARLLADHSDTTLTRAIGVSLEARLTGDRRRLERQRATPTDPVFKALDAPTSCAQLRLNLQVWRRLAQVGEIGLLHDHEAAASSATH